MYKAATSDVYVFEGKSVPYYTIDVVDVFNNNGMVSTTLEVSTPSSDIKFIPSNDMIIFSMCFDFYTAEYEGWDYSASSAYIDKDSNYLEVFVSAIGGSVTIESSSNPNSCVIKIDIPEKYVKYFKNEGGFDIFGTLNVCGTYLCADSYITSTYISFDNY